MQATNAAIYFMSDGYSTSGSKLMGRQAAGEGFLKAFLRHGNTDALYCYAHDRRTVDDFVRLRDAHAPRPIETHWIRPGQLQRLAEPGTLYLPGPGLTKSAWRRRALGAASFSLCGVTHTIASHTAMDAIAELLTAPVMPWDALVCTSQVVLDSVTRLLAAEAEYLVEHLGATHVQQPRLALIPLGTDCEALAPDPAARSTWRERMGIGAEDVAFLFVGRLHYHAKANPFPMYVALERAAKRSARRLHLIQAGWFGHADVERRFRNGARGLCPSVNAIFLDGRDPAVRKNVWQAADVFTSLADNIQETFGLTPIEAMAAGLPSVVSDWDGYRDTVRSGLDGFRIPTMMPPTPAGVVLALRHEIGLDSYDDYVGHASLAVSVDIPACTEAYTAIANDGALRRRMGEAARARARAEFDWASIVRRYQALWAELAELRRAAPREAAPTPPNPRRADPFWLFAGYPSRLLAGGDRLMLAPGANSQRVAQLFKLPLTGFGPAALAPLEQCVHLIERLGSESVLSVDELLEGAAPPARPALLRSLVWLHKLDLVRLAPSGATATDRAPEAPRSG
jgi:starch synthase